MPKRGVEAYAPKGIRLGHRFYSDDDIEAIIAAAGGIPDGKLLLKTPIDDADGFRYEPRRIPRRQALGERLEQAAKVYTAFSDFQTKPTATQVADAMAEIEAAAAKLLAALHLPEAMAPDPIASMPAALRYGALEAEAKLEARELGGLPRWSGEGLLRDSVHGVYRLQRWARSLQGRHRTLSVGEMFDKRHARDKDWVTSSETWRLSGRAFSGAG